MADCPVMWLIVPVWAYRPSSTSSYWWPSPEGFLIAKGLGITPGSKLPEGHVLDLPPTILKLMGLPYAEYFEGKSLL
ncbi:hypothetical protein PCC7805_04490 (plasmid) [Planktothrix agardhii]|uniref:hypothetical protein n=1 Tax=Planktothrix agardhii TaxID=1160 RepID=UPI0020A796C3|nr:hypothetical protein [Planktothrix agardhii]CAD5984628.1 hypothetical protein PCC7805_04490 [Planktothrix agardhii]